VIDLGENEIEDQRKHGDPETGVRESDVVGQRIRARDRNERVETGG
jgi:hypothetical protein